MIPWFRFLVWCIPFYFSCLIVLIGLVIAGRWHLANDAKTLIEGFCFGFSIIAWIALGYLDIRLALHDEKTDYTRVRKRKIRNHVIMFCLLQLVVAPAVGFLTYMGIYIVYRYA